MIWHSSDYNEVVNELSSNIDLGLNSVEADERLEIYGKNTITTITKPSFLKHLLNALGSKMVIALVLVSLVAFTLSIVYSVGSPFASLMIIAVVILNALFSAYHIYNSDKILSTLQNRTVPTTTVIRDGVEKTIPSHLLVPGDIILLNQGDYIAADARLIMATEFRCSQTALTGDTIPVDKNADLVLEDITALEQRSNMIYAGCNVVHGSAVAIVTATGLNTEAGHNVAIMQQTGDDALPLEATLDKTHKIINIIVFAICTLFFIIGILKNFEANNFAVTTINVLLDSLVLGIAAIPEGLPTISVLVIALGLERVVADKILVKKAKAVELLGKTSVICADKTGILTHAAMSLEKIYDGKDVALPKLEPLGDKFALILKLAAACSVLTNDATEKALEDACFDYANMSKQDIDNAFPRLALIPFDPVRKSTATISMINGKPFAIVKGAPEILIEKCVGCDRQAILEFNNQTAWEGMRNICIAMKPLDEIPASPHPDDIEKDLLFVGLLCIDDPPRNSAIEGIKDCKEAGIKTIMITGDNPVTARAVARRIGVLLDGTELITGAELENISDEELEQSIHKYSVFARVSPADKLRIIKAWQARGEIVTVTGDSIDDTDALSLADVGCAVGRNGTDVARGSADIVIKDNSFMSVVAAIKESRGLFENIRKSVFYLLSCNFGEVLAFLFSIVVFGITPINSLQLLWINLLTDCAPSISLCFEKAEDSVMRRMVNRGFSRLFNRHSLISGVCYSFFIALITIIAFLIGRPFGHSYASTLAFFTLGLTQIFHSYNLKVSGSLLGNLKNIFKDNKIMGISNSLALFLLVFLCFTPAGLIFSMQILNTAHFFVGLLLAASIIPLAEAIKLILKRIL